MNEREASSNLPTQVTFNQGGLLADGKGQGRCCLHSPVDCWNVLLEPYLLHWDLTNISLSLPVFRIKPLGSDHNTTPPLHPRH